MMIAPGADDFVTLSLENTAYANNTPSPGPGFASNIYMIDLPASFACSIPIGVKIPWLIALFKNNTLAGSIKIAAKGINFAFTSTLTPAVNTANTPDINGPMMKYPMIATIIPKIPTEKLLINISNPAGICPSIALSNFLMTHPANGPITMAPINIGCPSNPPTPAIQPMTAIAPMTPPRSPPTCLPPV